MSISQGRAGANNAPAEDSNLDISTILVQYDPYLVRQVQDHMHLHPDIVRPEVRDLETDELTQRVRIKFWHALEDKHIEYPKTYLRRIINSEFIDMVRRLKPHYTLDLPVDEEGELYQGSMLITPSKGMADPAVEYEEQVEANECLREVVDAVITLPARQQHAIICDMRDRVDDLDALTHAFKKRKTDIESWQWPQQKQEKLTLRASLAYARIKIGAQMQEARRNKALNSACKTCKTVC